MTEVYEFLNGLSQTILSEILKKGLPILLKKPNIINDDDDDDDDD